MEHPPEYLSDDFNPEDRRFYWQMKEIAARMAMQVAASRRERAELDIRWKEDTAVQRRRGAADYAPPVPRHSLVKESGPLGETQLDRIERRIGMLRVELESVKDDIHMVAGGFAHTNQRLQAVETGFGLLGNRLESVENRLQFVETRLGAVEHRLDSMEHRLDSVEHRLGSVEHRLGSVEHRLGSVDDRLDSIDARLKPEA